MPRIPFMHARVVEPLPRSANVDHRLCAHLQRLRAARLPLPVAPAEGDTPGGDGRDGRKAGSSDGVGGEPERIKEAWADVTLPAGARMVASLTDHDRTRITRRARTYAEVVRAGTGMAHLDTEARRRLEALRRGAVLVALPSEHRADEVAAALHGAMPWMAPATETV
jgi:hypothetical protein